MSDELETQHDVAPTSEPEPQPASGPASGGSTESSRLNALERTLASVQEQLTAIAQRLVPADTPQREPEQPPAPGPRWFRKIGH
jgi:hypothetical protein